MSDKELYERTTEIAFKVGVILSIIFTCFIFLSTIYLAHEVIGYKQGVVKVDKNCIILTESKRVSLDSFSKKYVNKLEDGMSVYVLRNLRLGVNRIKLENVYKKNRHHLIFLIVLVTVCYISSIISILVWHRKVCTEKCKAYYKYIQQL